MTYMCNKCFEIYNLNTATECKNCSAKLIQIDELLAPTIQILNKKGYTTVSSCSGHFGDHSSRCYIKFAPDINLNLISPDMYNYGPHGWYECGNNNIIQRWFTCETHEDLASSLIYNASFLLEWAKDLYSYNEIDTRFGNIEVYKKYKEAL